MSWDTKISYEAARRGHHARRRGPAAPAFVREGDALRVKVGDDHGAAWDGPSVSLERHLEVVPATRGSVQARGEIFARGKGAAVEPTTLDPVLAKYRDSPGAGAMRGEPRGFPRG